MAPRIPKPSAGTLQPLIDSFEISLLGARRAPKTVEIYLDAATRFAGHVLGRRPDADWYDIDRKDIELYIGWMVQQEYSPGYINQQYRAVQQFFKWFCDEEEVPNPFAKLKPPQPDEKLVPILSLDDLGRLIREVEKKRTPRDSDGGRKRPKEQDPQVFRDRRDAAILRMFASSGARLSEIAHLRIDSISLVKRDALVVGKGARERTIKFDQKTAGALDRYLRSRVFNKFRDRPELWLGMVGPMQSKSIYRMISRRGADIGLKIYPHMLRHTFSHNWLDKGGAEGDLMELNGWTSPQMLRRYGASAKAARAQRAYDRVDVLDGL